MANRCLLASLKPNRSRDTTRLDRFNKTMGEDRAQLKRVRRGLQSRYVESYPLGPADLEGTPWDLFQYMARQLTPKYVGRRKLRRAS